MNLFFFNNLAIYCVTIFVLSVRLWGQVTGQLVELENTHPVKPFSHTSSSLLFPQGEVPLKDRNSSIKIGDMAFGLLFQDEDLKDELKVRIESDLEFLYEDASSYTRYSVRIGDVDRPKIHPEGLVRNMPHQVYGSFGYLVTDNGTTNIVVGTALTDKYSEQIVFLKKNLIKVQSLQNLLIELNTLDVDDVTEKNVDSFLPIISKRTMGASEKVLFLKTLRELGIRGPSLFDLELTTVDKTKVFAAKSFIGGREKENALEVYFIWEDSGWALVVPEF